MRFKAPKLFDCGHTGPDSELFIVEGDSAQRSLTAIRNSASQAVLPMQGKPMNALKADLDDLQENVQFAALIAALGVTLREGESTDISSVRYGRLILLFDPDADGIHSRTLLMLFLYRWLPELLQSGRVFDAHAPQWCVHVKNIDAPVLAFTEHHLDRIRARLKETEHEIENVQRFRGLGSIPGRLLYERCVDPDTRELTELSIESAESAIEVFQHMRDLGRGL